MWRRSKQEGPSVNIDDKIAASKKAFLLALLKHNGATVKACAEAEVTRATVYNWSRSDPDFQKAFEANRTIGRHF